MKKTAVKPEDIQSLKFIEKIKVSPDENFIAISIKKIKDYKYINNITLYDINESTYIPITQREYNDRFISWSRDSKTIYFISSRENDKKTYLYSISIKGGEPLKIIEFKDLSLMEWQWIDEHKVLLLCQKTQIQGLKHKDETIYYEFDKPVYKSDGSGYLPKGYPQLYLLDLKENKLNYIKSIDRPKSSLYYDKDTNICYFISNVSKDIYARSQYNDIVSFNLETKEKSILKNTVKGPKAAFSVSKDKSSFSVISHFYPDNFSASRPFELIIYNFCDDKYINATENIHNSVQNNIVADMEEMPWIKKPVYSSNGKFLYFNVSEEASNRIYRYSFEDKKSIPLTQTSYCVIDYDIGKDLYAIISFPEKPAELYKITENNILEKLSGFNDAFLESKHIPEPQQLSIKNKDGFDIDYWILKPPDFDNTRKYPMILNIHGGPHAQFANTFFFEFQVMASAGYIVLYSNPTGSMGKGYEFSKNLERNWGRPDSQDLDIVLKEVLKNTYIDQDRLGITGGSYGGFMTIWMLGTTDYFKTGITERCVSNMIGMAGNSDFSYFMPRIFNNKFWKNKEFYWDMSPIKFINNINAPLMIVHSDHDHRTPIDQAESLYTALKILKKKAKLIIFPKESHGLNRGGDPRKRMERLNLFIKWFDKYLK